ncbi:MAG: hypothetical protein R3E31_13400 [Chloroflexota bacterium]|nr:hypothetical protein [Ardenticatenaceae bacterium]
MINPEQDNTQAFGLSRLELILLASLAFIALFLIIFINFPTDNPNTASWLPTVQNQLRELLDALIPYGIVGALGCVVAIAELTSTFQTYPRAALQTRWARILILINMIAAVLALVITRLTLPTMNPVLQVLSVGVGFQGLIRTKFVLAKPIGGEGEGEISVNLGWLYDQFQNLCRTQIDLELMNNRRTAVIHLLDYYPSLAELYDIAWYTIIARATLSPTEEAAKLAELEKLIDPKAPEQFARSSIALMILENGGPGYVNLLLDQAMTEQRVEAPTRAVSSENLVWQLVETYSLPELVTFTEQLTSATDVLTWVHNAAKPDPNATEASQKAAIAHFLLQQIGADAIQRQITAGSTTNKPEEVV